MPINSRSQGFTLIETVLFIVIVGIAVAAITQQFSQNVQHSVEPLLRQKAITLANGYIDEMIRKRWDEFTPVGGGCVPTSGTSACTTFPNWQASTAYQLGDQIIPSAATFNLHIYQATAVAGNQKSGAAEPTWPAATGGTVVDNNVSWTDIGKIAIVTADYGAETETRPSFDDIDDYHGLTNSPPVDASGTALGDFTGFTVSVVVSNVAWSGVPAEDCKRVVVTVTSPLNETLSFTFYRVNF